MASLGGTIGRPHLAVHRVQAGGDADDPAPFLGQHVGHNGAGHEELAAKVDGHDLAPRFGGCLPEIGPGRRSQAEDPRIGAGVVHQDVHAAQLRHGPANRTLRIVGVGDIGHDRDDAIVPTCFAYIIGGLFEPGLIDVHHRHPGPGAHQGYGHGASHTDGASSAGYDGYFSLKWFFLHDFPPCLIALDLPVT